MRELPSCRPISICPRSTNSHCGVPVQWNWLRNPTGLSRSCMPPDGMSGDRRAAGVPSLSAMTSSRNFARPSVSVNSTTCLKTLMCIAPVLPGVVPERRSRA